MSSQQTAVLLGGSIGDVPLVVGLQAVGRRVVTVGSDPTGPAHLFADEYRNADFSDADACTEIARRSGAQAVVPGSNDFAAVSAALVAERLGFVGHDAPDTVLALNRKERFRQVQVEAGIPAPSFVRLSASGWTLNEVEALKLPALVKPTDMTGGKGIRIVRGWEELREAVAYALAASRRSEVVVEEYLEGSRHGVTSLVVNGAVDFVFFDDEQYQPDGFRVVGTTTPASLNEGVRDGVIHQLNLLSQHLALSDGLLHAQFIVGHDGPVLVEATRRAPGDLYPWFVEAAVDYPYVRALLAPYLGIAVPEWIGQQLVRRVARWVVNSDRPGRYQGLGVAPGLGPAVRAVHEAFEPDGASIQRPGVTVAVVILDTDLLPEDVPPWTGGAESSVWAMIGG